MLGHGAAFIEGGVASFINIGLTKIGLGFCQFGPGGGDFDIILGHVLAQAAQVALGLGQGGLVILGLEGKEDLAGLDELVVVHRDLRHPARHPGRDHPHVTVDVGVIGADKGLDMLPIPDAGADKAEQHQYQDDADQGFAKHYGVFSSGSRALMAPMAQSSSALAIWWS